MGQARKSDGVVERKLEEIIVQQGERQKKIGEASRKVELSFRFSVSDVRIVNQNPLKSFSICFSTVWLSQN